MQEKVTMDAALSSDYKANLPEELLSLILEIPKADNCLDLPAEQDVPTTLTQYLLGWRLIFDHWSKASFKVQTAYVASVKEGNYLKGLLDFAFHVLTRDRGAKKVVNASKYDFRGDYPGQEGSTEAQLNSMLCHLYFLSLKHLPLLVKSWWRNDCPRALEKQVEDWTEKYV